MKRLAIVAALVLMNLPAFGAGLVATEDVILCKTLVDLKEAQSRLKAQDKSGSALYLEGKLAPCMRLSRGESVEQLDRTDEHVQVVTRHGTPRFIGWGDRRAFAGSP